MIGFLLALTIMVIHLIIMTINQETPQLLDDNVRQAYNSSVVDPLLQAANNTTLNNGIGIVLWGVFGYVLYAIIAFIMNDFSEWRAARRQVRIAGGSIVSSPMHRSLLTRIAWRIFVGVLFVLFTLAIMPAVRHVLTNDYSVLLSPSLSGDGPLALQSLAIWMLILHGYTVLLRLYMMRTRVLGEIIY